MSSRARDALQKIRAVANYQFGKDIGEKLFPKDVTIAFSKRTGKIRYVYLRCLLLATLKPSTGLFTLTVEGGKRFFDASEPKRLWVEVQEDVSTFVEAGGDVFAKHVTRADGEIRPGEEVVILKGGSKLVAVGKAILSGDEMSVFKRGVAVKIRKGGAEKAKKGKLDTR